MVRVGFVIGPPAAEPMTAQEALRIAVPVVAVTQGQVVPLTPALADEAIAAPAVRATMAQAGPYMMVPAARQIVARAVAVMQGQGERVIQVLAETLIVVRRSAAASRGRITWGSKRPPSVEPPRHR